MSDGPVEIGRLAPLRGEKRPVTASDRVRSLASGLGRVSATLETVAIVAAVVGVLAGVVLGFVTSDDGYNQTHPFVAAGFGLGAASVVGGMFNWCVARALRVFAEHTATLHPTSPQPLH